jgi:transposase
VTPANAPEATVTEGVEADLAAQAVHLSELHIDRAYLGSRLVRERPPDLAIYCKAWPVRIGDRFPKTAFSLDWEHHVLRCPAGGRCPSRQGESSIFLPQSVRPVPCASGVPGVLVGAASASIQTSGCLRSCASGN